METTEVKEPKKHSWLTNCIALVLSMAAILVGVATLVAYFDGMDWLNSFLGWGRFQYFLILLLCAGFFGVLRNWKYAVPSAILALVNLVAFAPYFVPPSTAAQGADSLKICQFNVNYANTNFALFDQYIRNRNPDVILLQELTNAWEAHMREQFPEYKYRSFVTHADPFGIGTFSRIPFKQTEIKNSSPELDAPIVVSLLDWNGKNVKVINLHTYPMIGVPALKRQSDQFAAITAEAEAAHDGPLIVAGDFNSPLWSSSMQELQSHCKVRSAALGMGWQPTWPRKFERFFVGEAGPGIDSPLLMLSIDHCMINDKLAVKNFVVHEDLWSDHNPLFIELVAQ